MQSKLDLENAKVKKKCLCRNSHGHKVKIGRNEPCPCGSGKKYKNCCGAVSDTPMQATEQINRMIAYKGRVGRQREKFCLQYIKHKQAENKEIMSKLIENAESKGETVTCHIGCSFCCVEQAQASLQECEAIVYYLYKHERALRAFLRRYPQWLSEVDKHNAIEKLMQRYNEMVQSEFSEESMQAYMQEGVDYARLNIPCPFLNDSKCLIYEVRPLVCANLVATTPAEWCNPTNPNWIQRKFGLLSLGSSAIKVPFYYEIPPNIEIASMPFAVAGILKGGFGFLSKLAGSDSLYAEAMNAPEIKATIEKLL